MRHLRKQGVLFLCICFICTFFAFSAPEATASGTEKIAELWQYRLYVDGIPAMFRNEQGAEVSAFNLNGTVYLPLRSAGEWLGADVQWEAATNTIRLQRGSTSVVHADSDLDPEKPYARTDQITVTERSDISVYLDSTLCSFQNEAGAVVYPVSYQNVTYLPIRSIAELCGLEVVYDPPFDAGDHITQPTIFLRYPITQMQAQEVEDYLYTADSEFILLNHITWVLHNKNDPASMRALALACKESIAVIKAIPKPSASFTKFFCDRMDMFLAIMEEGCALILAEDSTLEDMFNGEKMINCDLYDWSTGCDSAVGALAYVRLLLSQHTQ